MQELKIFFTRPIVKAAVIGVLTASFGVLCNWTVGSGMWWRWPIFVAFSIFNIVILCLYAKTEKSFERELDKIKQQLDTANAEIKDLEFTNEAFSNAMQGITAICKYSAKNANIQIHEIIDRKRLDCKTWNFDLASDTVCESIYENIIQKLSIPKAKDGIVDVEIGYVKLIEETSNQDEKYISLCGYHHPTRNGPKILGKNRLVEDKAYHDALLFYADNDQPDIQLNASAVQGVFKDGDGKDYSQYLGIPVFCSTQKKNSKMIGLLQIVCHGNSTLAENEDEMKTIANTFFTPYAYMFLLLYKMDKALRAQPKKRGEPNGKDCKIIY